MKPKILMVQLASIYGGAEIYYSRLSTILSERFELIHLVGSAQLHDRLVEEQQKTYRTSHIGNKYYLTNAARIISLIRHHKIDVVHLNGEPELLFAPLIAQFSPLSVTIHTDILKRSSKKPHVLRQRLKNKIMTTCARYCDMIICVAQSVAEDLQRYPRLKNKIHCIPNWPPARYLATEIRPSQTWGAKFRLLIVARQIKAKGYLELFKACRGIKNLALHCVGDGPDKSLFAEKSRDLDVTFHGYQKDPLPFYLNCDAVVLPTHSEGGNPLSLLEGMALGLPCIGSDIKQIKEMITDRQDGLLFPVDNAEGLKKAIILLMQDNALRQAIGNAARKKMLEKFSYNMARQKYLDCFSSLCEEPK